MTKKNLDFKMSCHNNQTILVTGGLGFIGSHLVDYIVAEHPTYDVVVFDNVSTGRIENRHKRCSRVLTVLGDIRSSADLNSLPRQGYEYVAVVHLAAKLSVVESMSAAGTYERANVDGAKLVIEWCRNLDQRCKPRFIAASSAAVYGVPELLPLSERSPLQSLSPYAETKRRMELAMAELGGDDVVTVALRFFNVYGPRQDPQSQYSGAITAFINRALRGDSVAVFGDGQFTRDFVYVGDVVRAIDAAIFAQRDALPADGHAIYNVGTARAITIEALARRIVALAESTSAVEFQEARAGDVPHSVANIDAIVGALGWQPTTSFDCGLTLTVEHQRKHDM
jgi:nucleoside-diphosphate-sugar epimerase